LHGARIVDYGTMMLEPCCVCYDDVKVDGAELANGDFETLAGGMPVGWQRVGRDRQHELVQTETGSNGTNHYVDAWYEAGLRTRLRGVVANRPVTMRVRVKNE
jgi:hypothetical protein